MSGARPSGPHKKSRHNGRPPNVPGRSLNGSHPGLPPLPPIPDDMVKIIFTHQSSLNYHNTVEQTGSYEQLEFVGDAYIEIVASKLIWDRLKSLSAGRMSQIREKMVKNETLAEFTTAYGLDKKIRVTADVMANHKMWTKVKGDVFEAYIAAIIVQDDKMGGTGYQAAEAWLQQLWTPILQAVEDETVPNLKSKDVLARLILSSGVRLHYREEKAMKRDGPGCETYYMGVFLSGWGFENQWLGSGEGRSKAISGNLAAVNAMKNPLIPKITEMKREYDEKTKKEREEQAKAVNSQASPLEKPERTAEQERDLVQKKRSLFLPTPAGG